MTNNQDFIKKYEEDNKDLIVEEATRKKKLEKRHKRYSFRNIMITTFLLLGIITLIIYLITTYSYYRYGALYNNLDTTLNTMGIKASEKNYFFSQFGPYKLGWSRIYKLLSKYFIIGFSTCFIISAMLWGFTSNFTVKSLFRKKGKDS